MNRYTKIDVRINDAMELKRIAHKLKFDMPELMHEVINYGLGEFCKCLPREPECKYDLSRFHAAHNQATDGYDDALRQIKAGRKTGHWMWYVFPQIKGLGRSEASRLYALDGVDEAREYLFDSTLGHHLLAIVDALLGLRSRDIETIMGSRTDMKKLCSSMTLFSKADPSEKRFKKVIDRFFGGEADRKTLKILGIPVRRPRGRAV